MILYVVVLIMEDIFSQIRFWPESNRDTAGQLADQLRKAIVSGQLKSGEKLPSSSVLAKKLSLGVQTIQSAFNSLVAEGLVVRRPRRGTFVTNRNKVEPLKTTKNYQIAWIVFNQASDSPKEPSLSIYLETMQKALRKHNCNLHIITIDPTDINSQDNVIFRSTASNKQIDAAVVRAAMPEDFLNILRDSQIPFVRHDFITDGPEPSVSDDPIGLTDLAVEHLLTHGHDKVAMVSSSITYNVVGPNIDATYHWLGFCRALSRHNIPFNSSMLREVSSGSKDRIDGYAGAMLDLAKQANRPTAIYVTNEKGALKGIELLKQEGFSVPEDISVIARGSGTDLDFLTTVQDELEKVGKLCAEVLLKILVDNCYPVKKYYFIPSFIIPRKSVIRWNRQESEE